MFIDSGLPFPWKTALKLPDGWSGAKGAREGCLIGDHPASSLENIRDSHETVGNSKIVSAGLDPKWNDE